MRLLNIFISHPSELLTDCRPHGDGLIADGFVRNLAMRGHTLHVAVERHDLATPYSSNVVLHQINVPKYPGGLERFAFAVKARAAFNKLSRSVSFDLVHQLNPVVTGLSLSMKGIDVPMVMGPYMPEWPRVSADGAIERPSLIGKMKTAVKRQIWKYQHEIASGILLSTPAASTKVTDPGSVSAKLHVVPFGIDTELFAPAGPPTDQTILFLANIGRHKGIFVLLEAFRKIHDRFPACKLLIAGSGNQLSEAQQVASRMESASQISFLGSVDRRSVPRLMNQCSVYCLPSYAEAFGMSALEAMACGRPVVAADAGGLAHIVTQQGGRKVAAGNSEALAAALIEILSDRQLAQRMGAHNRRLVEERYAWPRVIDQLESIYRNILANRSRNIDLSLTLLDRTHV
jgi:glycosyltransferase involved in cell wall biosynthesis